MVKDAIIIACSTLRQELELVMEQTKSAYPVIWIDSGLHVRPDKLRESVQEAINGLSPEFKTCMLLFGFCGNSMVGIKAGGQTLVLPKVSDCIPIFLGSQENRAKLGSDAYFFTEGYLHFEHTIFTEHEAYKKRYGEKRAKSLIKRILAHYKRFAVIDTGTFDPAAVIQEITALANELEIQTQTVPGNLRIIQALLKGDWAEHEFLSIPPFGEITFEDSLDVGKSQFEQV